MNGKVQIENHKSQLFQIEFALWKHRHFLFSGKQSRAIRNPVYSTQISN